MPYSSRAIAGTPYVLARLFGSFGFADAHALLRELTESHSTLAGKRVICDVRDGRVDMSFAEIFDLGRYFYQQRGVLTGVRWVNLVSGAFEYGIARSCGLAVGDVDFDYTVLKDAEQACHWLGIPFIEWQRLAESA